MESLLKQLQRAKSPAEEVDQGSRRRAGPRKSVSFDEGDRKKDNVHHSQRQPHDGPVKGSHYLSDGEYEMAVAAAAYAINALVDEGTLSSKRRPVEGVERSTTRRKSLKEDTVSRKPTSGGDKLPRWLSGKDKRDDREIKDEAEKMARLPSRKKGMGDARTIKWAPTFSDKHLNDEGSKKGRDEEKPFLPPPSGKPSLSSAGTRKANHTSKGDEYSSFADPWERDQMYKIRRSYEKTMAGILEWENEKKIKAKRKLERRERKIELRRATSLQEYKNYMTKIDNIAGGARALADERKRNNESKMREKAKERRLNGNRSYYSCFGF